MKAQISVRLFVNSGKAAAHREALVPVLVGLVGTLSLNSKDLRLALKEVLGETMYCGPVRHPELAHRQALAC